MEFLYFWSRSGYVKCGSSSQLSFMLVVFEIRIDLVCHVDCFGFELDFIFVLGLGCYLVG